MNDKNILQAGKQNFISPSSSEHRKNVDTINLAHDKRAKRIFWIVAILLSIGVWFLYGNTQYFASQ